MVSGTTRSGGVTRRQGLVVRAIAAAVVFVLSGGQALGALHQLLIPHQICAEHGHFVHGSDAAGLPTGAKSAEKTAVSSLPGPESHEHHDCCLAARSRDERSVLSAQSVTIGSAEPETQELLDAGLSPTPSGRSILLFAPKQSPPA